MTENEALKLIKSLVIDPKCELVKTFDFKATVIKALEDLQQYRAIGTVEELQKKMEELERWHNDRINENIKNPFAYTSTLICHNCDHKDEYIEELEAEVEEYHSVGTIEEFKDLKEKSEAKKIKYEEYCGFSDPVCPECKRDIDSEDKYCRWCGQTLKN